MSGKDTHNLIDLCESKSGNNLAVDLLVRVSPTHGRSNQNLFAPSRSRGTSCYRVAEHIGVVFGPRTRLQRTLTCASSGTAMVYDST